MHKRRHKSDWSATRSPERCPRSILLPPVGRRHRGGVRLAGCPEGGRRSWWEDSRDSPTAVINASFDFFPCLSMWAGNCRSDLLTLVVREHSLAPVPRIFGIGATIPHISAGARAVPTWHPPPMLSSEAFLRHAKAQPRGTVGAEANARSPHQRRGYRVTRRAK
jgi:hypothetical protein